MATATKSSSSEAKKGNKPVFETRLGRIKACVWANELENGVSHNVTIRRLYMTDDGWKESDSYGRDDLPLVEKVASKAHTWICEQAQETA